MTTRSRSTPGSLWPGRLGFAALVIWSLQFALLHYEQRGPLLDDLLAYRAPLPFQARVLPLLLIDAALWLADALRIQMQFLTSGLLIGLDAFAVVSASALVFRITRREFEGEWAAWLTLGAFLAHLTLVFLLARGTRYYYPSDLLAVTFGALFLLAVERRWPLPLLSLVVFVACLNRETILLLVPLYAVHALSISTPNLDVVRRACRGILLLSMSWAAAKLILYIAFADSPGVLVSLRRGSWMPEPAAAGSLRLIDNLRLLARPEPVINLLATIGLPWAAALWAARRSGHRFGRYLVALPLFFVSMLLVANFDEMRVFGETTVVTALAVGAVAGRREQRQDWEGDA